MKQVPRFLGVALILALLNVSYMSVALATRGSSRIIATTADPTLTADAYSEPIPEPTPTHVSKADIKQDLDDTKNDLQTIIGTDPNGFAAKLLSDAGVDPVEEIDDASADLDSMSVTDFDNAQSQFDKLHKKFQKRKHNMAAILKNPTLMAMLHRPSPAKFLVVAGNSGTLTTETNPAVLPAKSGWASTKYSKDLSNLRVVVMPELTSTCTPGDGVATEPANLLIIAKALTMGTEIIKEAIPEDTLVVPHSIAVVAWGAAKTAEFILDTLHQIYVDCKAVKSDHDTDLALSNLSTSISNVGSNVSTVKSDVTNIKTTVADIKTTTTTINNGITNVTGKVDVVNTTVNNIDNSITTINNKINNITNTVNTTSNNVNTANLNITAASDLSLRLMIEADLAAPDNATPLAIFETPAAKQGYLDLVRSIVATTIANLAGSSTAQANSFLAQGDAYKAAGNYKSAYAAYRKAYKSASN
jgi:archaellum component FlaC